MTNDSISTIPVIAWGESQLTGSTLLCLTPSVVVKSCYLSTMELPSIKHKLEVKLNRDAIDSFIAHLNDLMKSSLRFVPSLMGPAKKIKEAIETWDTNEIIVTIPITTKKFKEVSQTWLLDYHTFTVHRVMLGNLLYETCIPPGGRLHVPKAVTDTKAFFQLPEFTVTINGETCTPCQLCNLAHSKSIPNKSNCIYYINNYECLFASDIPITDAPYQPSALAAAMANIPPEDFEMVNAAESEDDINELWLKNHPEASGLPSDKEPK